MKTPIQTLIDIIELEFKSRGEVGYMFIKYSATELLEKEREVIEQAVIYGNRQEFYDGTETIGKDYFTKTFKTQSNESNS